VNRSPVDGVVQLRLNDGQWIESLRLIDDDTQAHFHLWQSTVDESHRFPKSKRKATIDEGVDPAHQETDPTWAREIDRQVGFSFECRFHVGHFDAPHGHYRSCEWTVDGFARYMVPIRLRFVVDEQNQSVVQPAGTVVMQIVVNQRSQTDSAVADDSESDHVGLTGKLSLSDVVIDHLLAKQRATLATAFEDEQLSLWFQSRAAKRLAIS